jgi:hypothetical protein
MAFEDKEAELGVLFTRIQNEPTDWGEVYEQIRQKLNELKASECPCRRTWCSSSTISRLSSRRRRRTPNDGRGWTTSSRSARSVVMILARRIALPCMIAVAEDCAVKGEAPEATAGSIDATAHMVCLGHQTVKWRARLRTAYGAHSRAGVACLRRMLRTTRSSARRASSITAMAITNLLSIADG